MTKRKEVWFPKAQYYMTKRGLWNSAERKWQKIIDVLEKGMDPVNTGCESCAFCNEYFHCDGCPIHEETGRLHCHGTPCQTALRASVDGHFWKALRSARAELRYLQRLRAKRGE